MDERRSRAALDAWLAEVDALLQGQSDGEQTDEGQEEDAA